MKQTEEDRKYRQGRSKHQYESSIFGMKATFGFVIMVVIYRIFIYLF